MSNAEHRVENVEVGIRIRTGILLDKRLACLPQAGYIVHCTWYIVLGTSYNIPVFQLV